MKIAVLLAEIGYDSQRRFMEGIIRSAKENKDDVYVFTCDAEGYTARNKYETGEFVIYSLPDFASFDAVIVNLDTIHNMEAVSNLIERLKASGKPCVSINRNIRDFVCVLLDNRSGLWDLLDHFHTEHGMESVFYITGPQDNNDAMERYETVRDYFRYIEKPICDEDVAWSDYSMNGGYQAMDEFLRSGRQLPDAVLAANDKMAIGAIQRLEEAGIRVPEDIIAGGYDSSELAKIISPGLSTVARNEIACGELAYELARKEVMTGIRPRSRRMLCEAEFSGSCGCRDIGVPDELTLRRMLSKTIYSYEVKLNHLKSMMAEATALDSFTDFIAQLREFILELSPKEVYVFMNRSPEERMHEIANMAQGVGPGRDMSAYTDTVTMLMGYRDGQFIEGGMINTTDLLPAEVIGGEGGNLYYILPLHHMHHCFGYIVYGNSPELIEAPFMQLFTLMVSSGFATVSQRYGMKSMMLRLDELRVTDELSGAYNRAGAKQRCEELRTRAVNEGTTPAVIFMDMDSLKSVNDHFGHTEGDVYIKTVADIIRGTCTEDDVLVRYGGDEFVVIMTAQDEEEVRERVKKIQAAFAQYNENHPCGYQRSVSIGWYIAKEAEFADIYEMIKTADAYMYKDKRNRKSRAAGHAAVQTTAEV